MTEWKGGNIIIDRPQCNTSSLLIEQVNKSQESSFVRHHYKLLFKRGKLEAIKSQSVRECVANSFCSISFMAAVCQL